MIQHKMFKTINEAEDFVEKKLKRKKFLIIQPSEKEKNRNIIVLFNSIRRF